MRSFLIVDDDVTFTEVLANTLRRRGFEACTAHSAQAAVERLRERPIDSIVLDLRLAADNGLELIPALCGIREGVQIVVLTGYASIATAVEAIKLGAHHYLTKPTDVTTLLNAFTHQPGHQPVTPEATPTPLERVEWEYIQQALREADGNVSVAAARLGLHRRTLQRKLKKRPAGLN